MYEYPGRPLLRGLNRKFDFDSAPAYRAPPISSEFPFTLHAENSERPRSWLQPCAHTRVNTPDHWRSWCHILHIPCKIGVKTRCGALARHGWDHFTVCATRLLARVWIDGSRSLAHKAAAIRAAPMHNNNMHHVLRGKTPTVLKPCDTCTLWCPRKAMDRQHVSHRAPWLHIGECDEMSIQTLASCLCTLYPG